MKRKLLTFVLLATVAVGGAFASDSSSRTVIQAGLFNAAAPCNTQEQDCDPIGEEACTVEIGGNQTALYQANPQTGKCTRPLYKPQ